MAASKLLVVVCGLILAVQLTAAARPSSRTPLRKVSCRSFFNYYKYHALKRVTPYGLDTFYFGFRGRGFTDNPCRPFRPFLRGGPRARRARRSAQSDAAVVSAAKESAPQAGVDFSTTNVQVAGVDEPDIVKTDGSRVYVVRGKDFFVVKVRDGGRKGRISGRLTLPSYAREMLFEKNSILVIAQEYGQLIKKTPKPNPLVGKSRRRRPFPLPFVRSVPITVVYKLRVFSNKPYLDQTLRMEGRYVSSREVNGIARIILATDLRMKFHFERKCDSALAAIARHKRKIRASKLRDWVPQYTLTGKCWWACKKRPSVLPRCSDIYLPYYFNGWDLMTIVPLRIGGLLSPRSSVSISSAVDKIYSTATSLYVTTTRYQFDLPLNFVQRNFMTLFHKFTFPRTGKPYLVASGSVTGSVLNQFSMHEHRGTFFVATTDGAFWWRNRDSSKSKVSAFRVERGRKLVKVGEVGNLGLGERIFSVRYIGCTAYVVTFRQIDPFYIIKLCNPYKLKVTGELKIPGFSSYLHPIGPGRILGVGRDATPEGRTTGAKVSLFDVEDVSKPKEVAVWTLAGSFTSAQWDHRAFLYWASTKTLVLPVSIYSQTNRFSGSVILKIRRNKIVQQGRVEHPPASNLRFGPSTGPRILRNFVLGRVYLWSLARNSIQVNNIVNLTPKSFLELPTSVRKVPPRFPVEALAA